MCPYRTSPCSGSAQEPSAHLPGDARPVPQDPHFPHCCPAVLPLPQVCSARRWGQEPQPGSPRSHPATSAAPGGTPRPALPLPEKRRGVIFESAQNSARLPHKSPYYSSGVGSKSGEDAARRSPRRRALGAGRCPGLRAAGAGRRKRSRGGGGGSFPFPQPWLRGRMLTVPAAWTIFVRTTRETEKERIWGGKERRVPS